MATILTVSEVAHYVKTLKQEGRSIVVAGGCFDILHIGHITLLEYAKKEGDTLVVLLESDTAIKKRKGIDRPIHTASQRAHMVQRLQDVDVVVLLSDNMDDTDYDDLMKIIRPDVIATTENDPHIAHKKRQAQLVGAVVKEVNKHISSISTTKLLDILSREI